MIGQLTGVIAHKDIDTVIVDVAGVGYEVRMPQQGIERLGKGEVATVLIHESIKEDAHDLYGFADLGQKQLFRQLLSVKNVGPKVALSILDIAPESEVRAAIASGDVKRLQSAKGVGKRAAEQIVVELRDKMGVLASEGAEAIVGRAGIHAADEALQALVSLGYAEYDAQQALQGVDASLPTEERIRQALKH